MKSIELLRQLAEVTETSLASPLAEQQRARLIEAFGDSLPADLVQILEFADGETEQTFRCNGIMAGECFLGSADIIEYRNFASMFDLYNDAPQYLSQCPFIKHLDNWSRGLIPIAMGYDGNAICMDTDPPEPGVQNQIVAIRPVNSPAGGVIARDLTDLLDRTLQKYFANDFDIYRDDVNVSHFGFIDPTTGAFIGGTPAVDA